MREAGREGKRGETESKSEEDKRRELKQANIDTRSPEEAHETPRAPQKILKAHQEGPKKAHGGTERPKGLPKTPPEAFKNTQGLLRAPPGHPRGGLRPQSSHLRETIWDPRAVQKRSQHQSKNDGKL